MSSGVRGRPGESGSLPLWLRVRPTHRPRGREAGSGRKWLWGGWMALGRADGGVADTLGQSGCGGGSGLLSRGKPTFPVRKLLADVPSGLLWEDLRRQRRVPRQRPLQGWRAGVRSSGAVGAAHLVAGPELLQS